MVLAKHSLNMVLSVIFINIVRAVLSVEPDTIGSLVLSIAFLAIWFIYGARQHEKSKFRLFILLYPAFGILLGLLFQIWPLDLLAECLQYIYVAPMRGFYVIQDYFPTNYQDVVEYITLFLFPGLSGYLGSWIHVKRT